VEQLRGEWSPPGAPVIRKVKYDSLSIPAARKLQIDTVQVEIKPLDLALLDRVERVYGRASGLSSNRVLTVAPAPDGSIWVGTDQGVAQYDGLWTHLDTSNGLPGNEVRQILSVRDGTVWMATDGGLARYRDGELKTVAKESFYSLLEDPSAGLWIGDYGQAAHLDTAWTYYSVADSTEHSSFWALPLLAEQKGAVWWWLRKSFTSSTVLRHDPPHLEVAYELPRGIDKVSLQAAKGGLWMGFVDSKQEENRFTSVASSIGLLDTNTAHLKVYRLPEEWESGRYIPLQDSAGLLWVFGYNTILQFDGERWSGNKEADFVTSEPALDAEGNFWFGDYNRGAIQYGPQTWTTYTGQERLAGKRVTCIVEDSSGNLWFGSEEGLSRRNTDGKWSRPASTDTLVNDLLVDRQGQVWAATARGVLRYDGHEWASYTPGDTVVTVLAEGADGRIWAGRPQGLVLVRRAGLEKHACEPVEISRRIEGSKFDQQSLYGPRRKAVDRYQGRTLRVRSGKSSGLLRGVLPGKGGGSGPPLCPRGCGGDPPGTQENVQRGDRSGLVPEQGAAGRIRQQPYGPGPSRSGLAAG